MGTFIPVAEPYLRGKEKEYVLDCIESNWISSLGKYIPKFEEKFAAFCGSRHGVSVSNGTTALHLALAALGIGKGDEVIIPDLTFVATANVCTYVGAKPVPVDSEKKTWNIDPEKIEEKITSKTRAIIPVHLYGHPCDMDRIAEIAEKHDLRIIEDAAEAHGARYKGKRVGSLGDVACFSFYGNKIITTGEGGMCTTDDGELAEKMKFLKDHGMDPAKRYWHPEIGFNFRMTNVQAAIGVAQMEQADTIIELRKKNAKLYAELLRNVKGITVQPEAEWAEMVYWLNSILVDGNFRTGRDGLIKELKTAGIDSRPFFYPVHELPAYKTEGDFAVSQELSRSGLNLPSSPKLAKEDIERICAAITGKN